VQDLAYLRLASWQDLIASFFDDDAFASELSAVKSIELTGGSASEMYYFLGWLASRLHWTPCTEDEFCNREGRIVSFIMHQEGTPRRLSRILLRSAHAEFQMDMLPEEPPAVCLQIRGEMSRPQRYAPLQSLDIATLVERGILTTRRDPVFSASLESVKHIIHYRKD
jgi:hypothetical protein